MSEHTPGPWNVLLHPEGDTVLYVIAGEATYKDGRTRAKWVAEFDDDSLEGEGGENEANARLVSSAPDLLAACEEALAMMDRIGETMGDYIHEREAYDLGVTLKAAIDRARCGEGTVP